MVIQALQNAGNGKWFKVLERAGLDNLVKERQLIRSTREIYDKSPKKLKPNVVCRTIVGRCPLWVTIVISLLVALVLRYFGIGATKEYPTIGYP